MEKPVLINNLNKTPLKLTDISIYNISLVDYLLYGNTIDVMNFFEQYIKNKCSETMDQNMNEELKILPTSSEYFEGPLEEVSKFSATEKNSLGSQLVDKDSEEINLAYEENATEEINLAYEENATDDEHLGRREFKIGKVLKNLRDRRNDEKCKHFVEENFSEDMDQDDNQEIKICIRTPEYFEDPSVEASAFSATEESSFNNQLVEKDLEEVNLPYEENATEAGYQGGRKFEIRKVLKNLKDLGNEEKCKRFLEENIFSNIHYEQDEDHSFSNPFEKLQHVPSPDDSELSFIHTHKEVSETFLDKSLSSTLNITYVLDHNYAKPLEEKDFIASPDDMSSVKKFCECLIDKLSVQIFTCSCGYQNLNEVVLQMSPQSVASNNSLYSEYYTEETFVHIGDQTLCEQNSNLKDHISSNTPYENSLPDTEIATCNLKDESQESKTPEFLTRNDILNDNSNIKLVYSSSEIYNENESPRGNSLDIPDYGFPRYNYSGLDSISLNSEDLLLSFSNSNLLDFDYRYSDCSNSKEGSIKSINEKNFVYNKGDSNSFLSKILQNSFEEKSVNALPLYLRWYEDLNSTFFANLKSHSVNSANRLITIYDTCKQNILKICKSFRTHNSNSSNFTPYNLVCREALLNVLNNEYKADTCDFISSSEASREELFSIKYSNSCNLDNIYEKNSDSEHFESPFSLLSSSISEKSESNQNLLAKLSENPYSRFNDIDLDVSNTTDMDWEYPSSNSSLSEKMEGYKKMIHNLSKLSLEKSLLLQLSENSSKLKDSITTSEDSFSYSLADYSQSNSPAEHDANNSLIKTTHPIPHDNHFESSFSSLSSSISKENSESFQYILAKVYENPLFKSSTHSRFYDIDFDLTLGNMIDMDRKCHSINSSRTIEEMKNFEKFVQNLSYPPLEDSLSQFSKANSSELQDSTTTSEDSFIDSNSDEYYTCREFENSVICTRNFDSSTPCQIFNAKICNSLEGSLQKDLDSNSDEYYTSRQFENSVICTRNFGSSTPCKICHDKFSNSLEGSEQKDLDSNTDKYSCREFENSVNCTRNFDSSTPNEICHAKFSNSLEGSEQKDLDLMLNQEIFPLGLTSQERLTCSQNRNSYIISNSNLVVSTISSISKHSLSVSDSLIYLLGIITFEICSIF